MPSQCEYFRLFERSRNNTHEGANIVKPYILEPPVPSQLESIAWGEPVQVFGAAVKSGDLIHADKHGFLIIPEEDQPGILEAIRFMDDNECDTVIDAALAYKGADAQTRDAQRMGEAAQAFGKAAARALGRKGEHG